MKKFATVAQFFKRWLSLPTLVRASVSFAVLPYAGNVAAPLHLANIDAFRPRAGVDSLLPLVFFRNFLLLCQSLQAALFAKVCSSPHAPSALLA